MYIFELIVKKILKKESFESYNPLTTSDSDDEYENCEHVFMPLDSSGETLACTKCGLVIEKKKLKKKNIFKP